MSSEATEIVYERPAPPARAALVLTGGVLFVLGVLWVTARALPSLKWFAVAVGITAAVFAAQLFAGAAGVLATRRVTADATALRIEHRRGVRVVAFAELETVAGERVTAGDGVTLDAVVLTLRGGERVSFGVASPEAAEGAARAIGALREAATVAAQSP